mgnify:CR=1 FL=1
MKGLVRGLEAEGDSGLLSDRRDPREVIIVDPSVTHYTSVVEALKAKSAAHGSLEAGSTAADQEWFIHVLDSAGDGIEQITGILKSYKNLDAVHLLSHGASGEMSLGATALLQQALRAGTAIGAHCAEAKAATTRRHLISLRAGALREAREALYWLNLIEQSDLCANQTEIGWLLAEVGELVAILSTTVKRLRDKLEAGILSQVTHCFPTGDVTNRLPNTSNIAFEYIEGEAILLYLDLAGIAVSTGSACASGSLDPSHVILATGLPAECAHGSIRISMGRENTFDDVDYLLTVLPDVIGRIRDMSSAYARRQ